jgi:glycosyltransferase involved in cell wall biosynthesis
MKILVYVEKAAVRGGIEVFAERHVARLRTEGHEVEVASGFSHKEHKGSPELCDLCVLCGEKTVSLSDFDEIIVHKCSDVATLELFPPEKTVYYVHDHEPICPRGYAYTPLKRNCARAGGVWPCIFCAPLCRGWKAALGRVFSQKRRIAAMSRFKKIVVISEFMKSRLVANGIDAAKIEVKPPVIRTDGAGETVPHSPFPVPHSPFPVPQIDLLYVGQLIRGKGVHLLLEAMARMKTPRTLDIVGTGNMEPKLKALAAQLGLEDRVRFNGFQKNPQDWMRRAACVVVPSFWQEPYGLVAAEAVALGRKVVAFAVGGLPEACQGKATLVPPGDVAALSAALELP